VTDRVQSLVIEEGECTFNAAWLQTKAVEIIDFGEPMLYVRSLFGLVCDPISGLVMR
jgi:hypothetical protein